MSTKRALTIVLVASTVMLAVGIGPRFAGTARALPSMQTGVTIPYSGSLTDEAGQPVADGVYGFTFALYEAESGGGPAWTEAQEGVVVQNGGFTARLGSVVPLPKAALDGGARWLEVSVRGPGEAEYTALSPRQELSAVASVTPASLTAPAALSCAHTHLQENWSGRYDGNTYALRVENTGTGDGIRGISYGHHANYAGVYGAAYGAGGSGVYGVSTNGFGVGAAGGGDAHVTDLVGDLLLDGTHGEIFSFGTGGMELNSNYDIRMRLDRDNNSDNEWFSVFNGAGSIVFRVNQVGDIVATGSKAGYVVDVAQNDDAVPLETGDVVVISGAGPAVVGEIPVIKVRLAAAAGTSAVIGVVDKRFVSASEHDAGADASTSGPDDDDGVIAPGEYLTIVTLGSFKAIKVDASYGAIAPGDLLVASPNPGYAMRAIDPAPGTIIGKALGALESGTGIIPVIVTMQ